VEALCCLTLCMMSFLLLIPVGWLFFVVPRQGKAARHAAVADALGPGWTSPAMGVFHGQVDGRRVQVSLTVQPRHGGGFRKAIRLDAAVHAPDLDGSWYTPRRRQAPGGSFDSVFDGDASDDTLTVEGREALASLYRHEDDFVDFAPSATRPLGAPAHVSVVVTPSQIDTSALLPPLGRLVHVAATLDAP